MGLEVHSKLDTSAPVHISFRRREELDVDVLLSQIEKIVQSIASFLTAGPLTVIMTCIEVPQGSGGPTVPLYTSFPSYTRNKKGIVSINNPHDRLCLARALVVGISSHNDDCARLKTEKMGVANDRRNLYDAKADTRGYFCGEVLLQA